VRAGLRADTFRLTLPFTLRSGSDVPTLRNDMPIYLLSSPLRRASAVLAGAITALALALVTSLVPADPAAAAGTTDSFSRQVSSGWGTAETGGTYSTYGPRGTAFSVDGSRARIGALAAGASAGAYLAGTSLLDTTATASVALVGSTALTVYPALEVRRQPDGSSYRGKIEMSRSGKVRINISRSNAGRETSLGSADVSGTAAAGTAVNVRIQVTGISPVAVSAKAWIAGSSEPAWQSSVSDGSSARVSATGATGVWAYASGSNAAATTLAVDGLASAAPTATSPASPPATTTPSTPIALPRTGTARGSVAVGSAAYAVPSGALFVNSSSGNDAAAGTQGAPLRSLTRAVSRASAGQTIVLRGGTYHESVVVPYEKPLTIQAFPKEAVWLDGSSTVSSFVRSGSTWVASGWGTRFSTTIAGVADNPRFVAPAAPLAARLDQVFLGGTQLRQVGSASAVVPGTFFVDYGAKTIRIGSDPSGKEVRASDLRQALQVQAPDTTVRGIGVRRYAASYEDRGAVRFDNVRATVQDVVVEDTSTMGIVIGNNDSRLVRVTAQRNGMLGVNASSAYRLVVRDSVIAGNNSERFKPAPVSGGIKITRSRDVEVVNNDTGRNYGSGMWFDESCYDLTVTGNDSNDNEYTGIQLELSDTAVVADNSTTGGQTGINVFDSGNVQLYNNTMGENSKFALTLLQDERRQSVASFDGQDPRRPAVDSTVPWLTRNITISNNVFANGGGFSIYALDKRTNIPVDRWNLQITGNLFTKRVATTDPTMVAWGQGDNSTLVRYETPAALAAAKNASWRNTMTTASTSVSGMSSYLTAAAGLAVALPGSIASLLGQPSGVKRVGIF
jgi:nitrous oxidase accessory protein NosD